MTDIQWITVHDRLPKDRQKVLFSADCGLCIGHWREDGGDGEGRFETDEGPIACVYHWAPLPSSLPHKNDGTYELADLGMETPAGIRDGVIRLRRAILCGEAEEGMVPMASGEYLQGLAFLELAAHAFDKCSMWQVEAISARATR